MDIVNTVPPDSDLQKLGSEGQQGIGDQSPAAIARENWRRYEYVRMRGHVDYCMQARRNEDFYLGGGLQWEREIKEYMEQIEGRPASECNEVIGSVNAAVGYQISNRMDVQFVPRSAQASTETAKVLDKVLKQILDDTKYKWHETQIFTDGLICQRGFLDARIEVSDNAQAEFRLTTLDPMDVIPDPDAKSYDPDDWLDVTVTRWLTAVEIGDWYGADAQALVVSTAHPREGDFGDGIYDDGIWRNRFGDPRTTANEFTTDITDGADIRYRIIDRQHHRADWAPVAIYPTGEIINIDQVSADELAALKISGVQLTQRRIKRVRWTVSACQAVLLKDEWSPFKRFTIIPYFPFFRRGRTRGLVDNAISPQETLNKAISQAIHIVNSTANSGWLVPENTLKNMDTPDLENHGASTGLIVEYDKAIGPPVKIEPNTIPTGMTNLIQVARENIQAVTGINESMLGLGQQDMSGVAIQSRQYAAQQRLAMPLDNLSRTRHMLAKMLLEYIQKFMPEERVIHIVDQTSFGLQTHSLTVNQAQPDGSVLHDLTVGVYDVVITDQPMQITFDNSQFEQIKSLQKDFGYRIPPTVALRYSNLPDKAEIAPILEQNNTAQPNPADEATTALRNAQAALAQANEALTRAKATQTNVTAVYSATQAAAQAEAIPHLAPVADAILASSGFPTGNPIPPAVPSGIPAPVPGLNPGKVPQETTMPKSTDPLTPAHPDIGVDAGIRKPQ